MSRTTSAAYSTVIRVSLDNCPGTLTKVISAIADKGGNLGDISIVKQDAKKVIRDISLDAKSEAHVKEIVEAVKAIQKNIEVLQWVDRTFDLHEGGKLDVRGKIPLKSRDELSMAYTPGVARVCEAIRDNPDLAFLYTIRKNCVAVVSDGTAVLGLGDIGPLGAMPVMEGKAMLFKEFAGVNAFPICLATKDPEEIIKIVKALAPTFGGINLEDIKAPECFAIEERLKNELDIPVFHDDQHGTAIVVGAAFLNAIRMLKRKPEDLKVVCLGVGASGTACTKMLLQLGVKNIIGLDRKGALYPGREDMNSAKEEYAAITNPKKEKGSISEVMKGADMLLGLSGPGLVTVADVKSMNKDPIIFAMSNPEPEIRPEDALPCGVAIMATGRSDFPNQINNVLAFPGVFKGALSVNAKTINEEMKLAAARAIADIIKPEELNAEYIIPGPFDTRVADAVSAAVAKAAQDTKVDRKVPSQKHLSAL